MNALTRFAVGALLLVASGAQAQQPKTYFDHIANAWALASLQLQRPLAFRDGLVLAYPGYIKDLVRARTGKPRTVLVIHELSSKDMPRPYEEDEIIFAPLGVLSRHSFWRDNLPKTPHHTVLGGQRYVFRGDDIAVAKQVGAAYAETLGQGMPERMINQTSTVVASLAAGNKVIREDAVRWLAGYALLARDLKEPAVAQLGAFMKGDWPDEQRVSIIDAVARARLAVFVPVLEELAGGDGEVAAGALKALSSLGKPRDRERLAELLGAETTAVRAYAARELGRRIDSDGAATVGEILSSDDDWKVRVAATEGLASSGSAAAVAMLREALFRGDRASRAAALALARIGNDDAVRTLKEAVVEAPSEGMIGAVVAMTELRGGCEDCLDFLLGQARTHSEEAIKDLIAIVLELDHKHEH